MAVITNLDVNLQAKTRKFDRPLKKSRSVFGTFTKSFAGGFGALPAIATGVAAGVTAAAATIGAGVVAVTGKISDLNKSVKDFERFGLSAGESFGQFRVLAQQAGLDVEDLVDLTKDLSVRIGEANIDGEGEIFNTFGRLGLNVRELQGLKPAEQLKQFSAAIANVGNETERLAITDILLSDAGTKALNVMSQGAEAFDNAATQARNFGLEVSSVDTAQLEQANNAMSKLGLALEGIWQKIAIEAAPTVTAIIDTFLDGNTAMQGFGNFVETAFSILNEGIAFAINGWNIMSGAIDAMVLVFTAGSRLVLNGLAKIESVLVSFGGKRFDFGIGDLADRVNKEADKIAKRSRDKFARGFSGQAGEEFKNRLQKIRDEAEKSAAKDAQKQPPPVPVDFKPKIPNLNLANTAKDFGKGVLSSFKDAGGAVLQNVKTAVEKIPKFEPPKIAEPEAPPDRTKSPSISAMAAGSSAALSTIINARKQSGGSVENVVKQTAKAQLAETKRTNRTLERLTNPSFEFVPVALGGA